MAFIIVTSMSFSDEKYSDQFKGEKFPPKDFLKLKSEIDSATSLDTIQINKCFERVMDTASFNIDSLYASQTITDNRYEYIRRTNAFWKIRERTCQGYSIFINGYSSAKYLKFSDSTGLRFIAQSSHDTDGSPDLMVVKFTSTKYAYVREHVCGMAIIPYTKEKINPEEFILGETLDDIWHLVEFENRKIKVEDMSEKRYQSFFNDKEIFKNIKTPNSHGTR